MTGHLGLRLPLLVLALQLAPAPVAAQKNPPRPPPPPERLYRGGVGLLLGSNGLGAALDLSMNHGARLYRFRMTAHDNTIMRLEYVERHVISETAVMLGRGRRYARNYGSVSAGLALVDVITGGDGEESRTTVGIPVEAQLISGGPLKLGATLAGNLNLERPFAAFILSVQLGRVPER